jgi:hypothetical protein
VPVGRLGRGGGTATKDVGGVGQSRRRAGCMASGGGASGRAAAWSQKSGRRPAGQGGGSISGVGQ